MIYSKKLKTDKNITGLLPAFFCFFVSGITAVIFSPLEGIRVMGCIVLFYTVFAFIALYKTKSKGYLSSSIYMFFMGLYLMTLGVNESGRRILYQTNTSRFFLVLTLAAFVWLLYMLFTKQAKWRGREIFELAAIKVEEDSNTYTDRPRPVGRADYTKDEVLGFASYLTRNMVVMPFWEQERILLLPVKMGYEYPILFGANLNYWEKTWVSFDFDGNVSCHISKKDYLDYQYNLEFDQLCESLGNLFIEFLYLYKNEEETRIIDRLNDVKVGIFS